jgi:hypothetical protein
MIYRRHIPARKIFSSARSPGNALFTFRAQHAGMSTLNASLVQSDKPESFLERGVAVPFTTPQLAGARIRHAERTGTEFVVPNPSGGRGVYILHWGGVRQLCRPTVHDTILHQRISRLPSMDPGSVRLLARQLAAEGLAGQEASVAAAASAQSDRNDLILVNFLLLVTLMEQVEPGGLKISADTEQTPELDKRARRIVTQVGALTGRAVARISADLETLSALFVPIGLEAEMPRARLPRLTARIEAIAEGLATWSQQYPDDICASLASSLARSAAVTARCARSSLGAARTLTGDMRRLLQTWAATPAEIVKQTASPEWILDGWERVCLLWETADSVSVQRAVLREMAQLVPMLPKEANHRREEREELEKMEPVLRAARLNVSWRGGGASQALIARNEQLQALIA